MFRLRQTSSVPPKDGVHVQAAFLALRAAATSPELPGPPAALLYALRTRLQITASAATGGGLPIAAAMSVCSLVMSPSRLDDPLPELTATLSEKTRLTSPQTLAAWTTVAPLYHLFIAAVCAAVVLAAAGVLDGAGVLADA